MPRLVVVPHLQPPVTTVHFTNAYHETSGGVRTFYHQMLAAANRVGRRMVLVVPAARSASSDVGPCGRIEFIKAPQAPAFDRRYRMLMPHRYLPWIHSAIVRVLEREQPDVVEICDKYTLPYLAAMLRKGWHARVRRPALVGLSCERFDDNMAAYLSRSAHAQTFTRWYLRHVYGPPFDAHVAISEYTAGELREALHDRPAGFIRICPMGVDVESFGASRASATLRGRLVRRVSGNRQTVLLFYAGRLSPEKHLDLLLDALRILVADGDRDYRLAVAGDGPLAGWLRTEANGVLAGRVALCGQMDRNELAACYASCDVFVHPNPCEPFGIGPLEAMASGVPVVVARAGGVLEYANDANAWLARPTAPAFAQAIRAAVNGDESRLRAAAETARRFRWEAVTARYFAVYDEVVLDRRLAAGWGTGEPVGSASERSA